MTDRADRFRPLAFTNSIPETDPMRLLLALAVLSAVPAAAAAQQGPEGRGQMPMNAPFAFEGPPAPAAFDSIVGLTVAQKPKYAALHKAFMSETRSARDSVRALRTTMREAMAAGGSRESARPLMAPMREQAAALVERYEEFEGELGFLLDSAQTAKFEAWKEKELTRLMSERRRDRSVR